MSIERQADRSAPTSIRQLAAATVLRLTGLLVIVAIDRVIWSMTMPRAMFGVCDEIAHLATALLIVDSFRQAGRRPGYRFVCAVAVGSTAIDVDHVPMELFGSDILTHGTGRPFAHTALIVGLVIAAATLLPGTSRRFALGVGVGMALHLLRDCATGGAPLLWPASTQSVTYPHAVYLTVLAVAASVATLLQRRNRT